MRLIGVRYLLECDEALTNARSPQLPTGQPPWSPSLSAAALDQARRCQSEVPPIGRHYSTTRPNRRPGFQPGINVAESAIKT
jgi:hypothetical protein